MKPFVAIRKQILLKDYSEANSKEFRSKSMPSSPLIEQKKQERKVFFEKKKEKRKRKLLKIKILMTIHN